MLTNPSIIAAAIAAVAAVVVACVPLIPKVLRWFKQHDRLGRFSLSISITACGLASSAIIVALFYMAKPIPVPIGTVAAWPLGSTPAGWHVCDGSPQKRQGDFGKLNKIFFNAGYPYGEGDGKGTFNLPNYEGYFLRGAGGVDPDLDSRIGGAGGEDKVGSVQGFATDASSIDVRLPEVYGPSHGSFLRTYGEPPPGNISIRKESGAAALVLVGDGKETRPRNVSVQWMIFYGGS